MGAIFPKLCCNFPRSLPSCTFINQRPVGKQIEGSRNRREKHMIQYFMNDKTNYYIILKPNYKDYYITTSLRGRVILFRGSHIIT